MSDDTKINFLKYIDQYALPIQLKYKMSVSFKSLVGGLFSIVIYVLFGALCVYLFVDMTDKINQNIVKFPRREKDPPRLNLTSDNGYNLVNSKDTRPAGDFFQKNNFFFFGFTFQNKSTLEQIPFTTSEKIFVMDLRLIKRNASTGKFTDEEFYEFTRCGDIYKEYPFPDPTLNEGSCLNQTNIPVEGDFISPIYQYVNIKFKKCGGKKPNCYANDVIEKLLPEIIINFVGTNFFINPRIVEMNPFTTYVPYKLTMQISNQVYQKYDVYVGEDRLISQENLLIPSLNVFSGGVTLVKKVNPLFSNLSSSVIAIYIRSNYDYNIYHRSYKSFIEVVAQIGGIWKVLYLIGAIFMIPLNSKLLMVSLGNKMFNLIKAEEDFNKEINNDNYASYLSGFNAREPDKILKLSNKTKLEAEMSIDYYKYERHRGLEYSAKEAFASIFFICCKPKSIKDKETILEDAEKRLYNKLNTNNIFKFSVQIGIIKKILLGPIKALISYSTSSAIHTDKISSIKELMKRYKENDDMDGIQTSLYKEVDLINGLRALQSKPMLDERVDINLLMLFKFKEQHIKDYFINHYLNIERFLNKITKVVEPGPNEDVEKIGRRKYLSQKEINERLDNKF